MAPTTTSNDATAVKRELEDRLRAAAAAHRDISRLLAEAEQAAATTSEEIVSCWRAGDEQAALELEKHLAERQVDVARLARRKHGAELAERDAAGAVRAHVTHEFDSLIAGLEPEAQAAREGILDAAEQLTHAVARWQAVRGSADELISLASRQLQDRTPLWAPGDALVQAIGNAVTSVPSPLPFPPQEAVLIEHNSAVAGDAVARFAWSTAVAPSPPCSTRTSSSRRATSHDRAAAPRRRSRTRGSWIIDRKNALKATVEELRLRIQELEARHEQARRAARSLDEVAEEVRSIVLAEQGDRPGRTP